MERPFRALKINLWGTQGAALGWYGGAPAGLLKDEYPFETKPSSGVNFDFCVDDIHLLP